MPVEYKVLLPEEILNLKIPITLKFHISIDNKKQQGEQLAAWVKAINEYRDKFIKIEIIDTTFLNRHYKNKYADKTVDSEWLKANRSILSKLKVNYEIIKYYEFTRKSAWEKLYHQLKADYKGDKDGDNIDPIFKDKVDALAKTFTSKGRDDGAVLYLLDECAACITCGGGYYVYPGELNDVMIYVREKYSKIQEYKDMMDEQNYISYSIRTIKVKTPPLSPAGYSDTARSRYEFFSPLSQIVVNYLDISPVREASPEAQREFIKKFISLCEEYEHVKPNNLKGRDNANIEQNSPRSPSLKCIT